MIYTRGKEKVLVVEDEEIVRELSVRLLTRAGYRVSESGNGLEALEFFAAEPDAFDLLLVDLRIPGMSGEILVRRIRDLRPRVPVLFTSGLHFESMDPEWATEKDIGFLAKPYHPDTLLARIRMILDDNQDSESRNSSRA